MRSKGVRGIRVNVYKYKAMDDVELQKVALRAHLNAIREQCPDWSMAFTHTHPEFWQELKSVIREEITPTGISLITDHFALLKGESMLPEKYNGDITVQPGFKHILDLVRSGDLYVKISAPYRVSESSPGYGDLKPLVRALVDANVDRILWGSDW